MSIARRLEPELHRTQRRYQWIFLVAQPILVCVDLHNSGVFLTATSAAGLGVLEVPGAGVTYLMDVLEEVGSDAARRCYWDFGDWSDIWRETKPVPAAVTLEVRILRICKALVCNDWTRLTNGYPCTLQLLDLLPSAGAFPLLVGGHACYGRGGKAALDACHSGADQVSCPAVSPQHGGGIC
jgi:hypothetical protein